MNTIREILYRRFSFIVLVIIAITAFFEIIKVKSQIDLFVEDIVISNEILADSLQATLAFESKSDFEQSVSKLDFENDYILIRLIKDNGEDFISKGDSSLSLNKGMRLYVTSNYVSHIVSITNNDMNIGELLVVRSTMRLRKIILNDLIYFLLTILAVISSLFLLGKKTSLEIIGSISSLNEAFQKIIKSGDLNYKSDGNFHSKEIFDLSESFSVLVYELKKSRNSLENLNKDLERRIRLKTEDLSSTVEDLQKFQKRLVAQEKLASLGALSAGVAHEIKNPLNLISNSSKIIDSVVKDVKELEAKLYKGNEKKEVIEELDEYFNDLKTAARIITKNSERADGIIRSMLQQTRSEQRVLEFVNFNEILDRVISLSYHSVRAKDKNFEVNIIKEVSQGLAFHCYAVDLERALINLLENSFYAVRQRASIEDSNDYLPEVYITINKNENFYEISVRDNGIGMSEETRNKILEPFFTTKPAGEGTGLGMSMIYDIAIAHNGDLEIISEVGNGTEVILKIDKSLRG